MNKGLMWFDDDPKKDLVEKLDGAVSFYYRKFGENPNLCFIHPTMGKINFSFLEMKIKHNKSILPNHFWIGVKDEQD